MTSSACAATYASIGRRASGVNNPIGSLDLYLTAAGTTKPSESALSRRNASSPE